MENQGIALAAPPIAGPALEQGELDSYELSQRRRTLYVIIGAVLAASLVIGTFDLQFNTWDSVIALYGLALLCIPALILNRNRHFFAAASLLSVIALIVITINLYDGDGVRDNGLMAYPIFIMIGTLFFGKRAAPVFAVASVISIALIIALEIAGYVHPTLGPTKWGSLVPIVTLMVVAAVAVWVTIGNMEGHLRRARQSEAELSRSYELTLEAWAKIMELRDRETEGHSRRLVELGTQLGRALGMGDREILALRRGALLHDIGKLAIPDDVLLKPGLLDDRERKIVQQHTVYAKQMLTDIPFLQPSIPVAFSHHERWDGLGYPEGLQGEDIPLSARVFAVIDTWDALSSERVYRGAWPKDQIAAYIKANAGIKFDPRVVEVFLQMMA